MSCVLIAAIAVLFQAEAAQQIDAKPNIAEASTVNMSQWR